MPHTDPSPTDHVYNAAGGFIFTSSRIESPATERPSAVLLLSACGRPFELLLGPRTLWLQAAVVRPRVRRGLRARGVALVSVNVHPTHAAYRSFLSLRGDGVLPLPRGAFTQLDAELAAAGAGALDRTQGVALFTRLVDTTHALLPSQLAPHPDRAALLAWLQQHPQASLGELAAGVGVSYHRMSHLFTDAVGLPFRGWCSFERMVRAARAFDATDTLTGIAHEAGYTDSAHLSRTWQRVYGLTPSSLRNGNSVQALS
ncbi:MAG: helix-turn-helix transcriptional regulator [Burkholderiales bacterium]|nr:helix-turn-helix transcriptional regulator [Burkholderiales bacterium]